MWVELQSDLWSKNLNTLSIKGMVACMNKYSEILRKTYVSDHMAFNSRKKLWLLILALTKFLTGFNAIWHATEYGLVVYGFERWKTCYNSPKLESLYLSTFWTNKSFPVIISRLNCWIKDTASFKKLIIWVIWFDWLRIEFSIVWVN